MSRKPRMSRLLKWAVIVAVCTVLIYGAYMVCLRLAYPQKYEQTVTVYAAEYHVPPSLVYAIIHTESHFKEDAVSSKGAKGLMQLTDDTYRWVQTKLPADSRDETAILDPVHNIQSGTKLLAVLHGMFGDDTATVLAAYNAGSTHVTNWLKDARYSADGKTLTVIPFEETEAYVRRVLQTQKRYQALYGIE